MTHQNQIITIAGGTEFLGRYIVKHMAEAGFCVRVLTRNPDAALAHKIAGDPGEISLIPTDISSPETYERAVFGSYERVTFFTYR